VEVASGRHLGRCQHSVGQVHAAIPPAFQPEGPTPSANDRQIIIAHQATHFYA
jgi:hypothetical protein